MNTEVQMNKFEKIFSHYERKLRSNGMSVRIENESGSFVWEQSSGDLKGDQNYMIASVSKMFATTILLNLMMEGKLSLEDPIGKYLPKEYMDKLHVYKGTDYSHKLTMKHLMTQTKELHPKFTPGSKKRSYYSDANWDILQPIVENISQMSISECYQKYIIEPLGLTHTYLFTEGMEFTFPDIWIEDGIYKMPKLLLGWPLSGSVVSTNQDMIAFLKAFYSGELFPIEYFNENNAYYYMQFFPLEYGLGNARFRYPGVPHLFGHSGAQA